VQPPDDERGSRMHRILAIATVCVAVLALAGVGAAHLIEDGTQQVSATFTAARERADVRTCTGADGVYEIVNGRYAGTSASSQPVLNGPIVLTVRSIYNTTERIGWIRGSLRISGTDHAVRARLVGTLTQGASDTRLVDGFVDGPAGGHSAALLGNVTAAFTASGGFSAGKIGEGGPNLALLAGRVCKPPTSRIEVKGRITALTSSSITIQRKNGSGLVTCQIRPNVSPSTQRLRVGDTVEAVCGLVDGSMTLLKVEKKRDGDDD
jgi:hypothetical protein